MKEYIPRLIDKVLKDELTAFGAVLITGPKWCGKTTAAKQHAKSIINFQDQDNKESYIQTAMLRPSALLIGDNPRLIDEWQVIPQIWDAVRQEVDNKRKEGLFILTGSSRVDTSKIMHSGVGRISRIRMRTMSLYESGNSNGLVSLESLFKNEDIKDNIVSNLTLDNISELVVKGGWPKSINRDTSVAIRQNKSYVDLIVSEEMETIDGKVRDKYKVLELLKSLARNTATAAADQTVLADVRANNESMHITTLNDYVKTLKELYVIEDLPAWTPKLRSRATIRTKHVRHFTDPAIAAVLLNASPTNLIYDVETFGLLFESMVVRDLRVYSQYLSGEVFHYRDSDGLETDAIIHLDDGRWGAIEIKLGAKQIDEAAKNLLKLANKVDIRQKPSFLAVVTATQYGYKRDDGVYVIPIGCLKP
ncbi:MAG: ATP-binding protein [Acholeplasmataceae bacterium]|jgi:predicted AAA+ superfamily ATPase|nr:ATP-binding protein [Acholeplasmataceae bacterium]